MKLTLPLKHLFQLMLGLGEAQVTAGGKLLIVRVEPADQKPFDGRFIRKLFFAFNVFFQLLVERFDEVGGIQAPPDGGWEIIKGE